MVREYSTPYLCLVFILDCICNCNCVLWEEHLECVYASVHKCKALGHFVHIFISILFNVYYYRRLYLCYFNTLYQRHCLN